MISIIIPWKNHRLLFYFYSHSIRKWREKNFSIFHLRYFFILSKIYFSFITEIAFVFVAFCDILFRFNLNTSLVCIRSFLIYLFRFLFFFLFPWMGWVSKSVFICACMALHSFVFLNKYSDLWQRSRFVFEYKPFICLW